MFLSLLVLLSSTGAAPALAHSQSYGFVSVRLQNDAVTGTVELAVRDIDTAYDLDVNRDAAITWGEFRVREAEIAGAVLSGIKFGRGNALCVLTARPALTDQRGGETYLVLPFDGTCGESDDAISIEYNLLFDVDAQHRGLINLVSESGTQNFVMTPATRRIEVLNSGSALSFFLTWVKHGIDHILIGYDHILFVLTLLLGTAALNRKQTIGVLLIQIARVVTAFTLSHSVTLALAAIGIINVPIALAESLIAVTIALSAVNNIRPVFTRRIWLMALLFGLVHGVGFANVLRDLGLPQDALLASLLAFNIGVELGQAIVVIAAFPVILMITRWRRGGGVLVGANMVIIVIAAMWFSDRAFGTSLMPF